MCMYQTVQSVINVLNKVNRSYIGQKSSSSKDLPSSNSRCELHKVIMQVFNPRMYNILRDTEWEIYLLQTNKCDHIKAEEYLPAFFHVPYKI